MSLQRKNTWCQPDFKAARIDALGGIWFDAEGTGGVLYSISKCTPFLYCTKVARSTVKLDFTTEGFLFPILIVIGSGAVLMSLAVVLFKRKMRADLA